MAELLRINRRTFVAGPLALGALATAPILTASPAIAACSGEHGFSTSRWTTVSFGELGALVGDHFSLKTKGFGRTQLALSSVEETVSGPDRPKDLAREEGIVAHFTSADMRKLADRGHQTYCIRHGSLGSADLFMGPVYDKNGRQVMELILN